MREIANSENSPSDAVPHQVSSVSEVNKVSEVSQHQMRGIREVKLWAGRARHKQSLYTLNL